MIDFLPGFLFCFTIFGCFFFLKCSFRGNKSFYWHWKWVIREVLLLSFWGIFYLVLFPLSFSNRKIWTFSIHRDLIKWKHMSLATDHEKTRKSLRDFLEMLVIKKLPAAFISLKQNGFPCFWSQHWRKELMEGPDCVQTTVCVAEILE